MTKSSVLGCLLGVALLAAAAPARADIILLTGTDLSGQGIGSTLTVLTLQSPRNSTNESGGVNFDGSVFGDTQPGALKNRTFTLADLGIASAGQLALLLDLSEPSSEKPSSVTVTSPFTVAADTLAAMRLAPAPQHPVQHRHIFQELREGFSYTFGFGPIRSILLRNRDR